MSDPMRPTNSQGEPQQAEPPAPPIDMQRLAEKVYRLLLEDLRLERARAGSPPAQAGGKR
jgi:hypothetical protein